MKLLASTNFEDVSAHLEFTGDTELGDNSIGVLPFKDDDGNLQVRRLIETGEAVVKVTNPIELEYKDITIFDQTWREEGDDDGAIQGIATVCKLLIHKLSYIHKL